MRLFVAVDISAQVRKEIDRIQRDLRQQTGPGKGRGAVKWVRPELIHLTLKFLGEVSDEAIRDVCRITEETARSHPAFEMTAGGLGTFGRPPRVLWAGVQSCPELMALQADLEERFDKAGWPREQRAFSAHLTLCRIKAPAAGIRLAQALERQTEKPLGATWVEQVIVYESQLGSDGPVYTPVGTYDLQG